MNYSEDDARAIFAERQHKATRQRVGVLLLLMNHRKAFTLKRLAEQLCKTQDRVTVYRTLKSLQTLGLIQRAINDKGASCYFYARHLPENKHSYLECTLCGQLYGLPVLPMDYLNVLGQYNAVPMLVLLKGQCKSANCPGHN